MKNYALIVQGFESILKESYDKNDKKTTSTILNEIKSNKELSKLYVIVDNLKRGKVSEGTVDSFINENIQFAKEINYSKIKFPLSENIKSDEEIYNSIGKILFEEKSPFNLMEYNEAYSNVRNNLLESNSKQKNLKETVQKLSESFEILEDADKVLVEGFVSTPKNERGNLFEVAKSTCINLIAKHISNTDDDSSKVKMYETKEVVSSMNYSEDTFISDMIRLHDFNKQLV
jgi:chaperonin cofactor prefoldin